MRVFARAFGIGAREGRIHAVDELELPVAADVIVMGMRVQDDDRPGREAADDGANIGDAHSSVEEESLLGADDEIGNDFFGLVRFVDGERGGRDLVNFKPGDIRQHPLEGFVFGAGEIFAPVGSVGSSLRGKRNAEHRGHREQSTEGAEKTEPRKAKTEERSPPRQAGLATQTPPAKAGRRRMAGPRRQRMVRQVRLKSRFLAALGMTTA